MEKLCIYGGEPMLDYVLRKLEDTRKQWKFIAEITGVAKGTIYSIYNRSNKNPRINTVQALADYFVTYEQTERLFKERAPDIKNRKHLPNQLPRPRPGQ